MSRKGEAEPHEPRRVLRLAEPCRDAQGCVEIHRKLLPQHPPPSATDPGGHLENIRNVTRRLPRAAGSRRAGCLLPCGILFLFSPLCCSLQYVTGIWEPSPDTRLALVILNVGWLVLQRLIPVRERSRCNIFCCFNLPVSQAGILGGFLFSKGRTNLCLSSQVPLPHVCLHGLGITPAAFGVKALARHLCA